MFNLFDILQAQGGPGLQGFGNQYGLSPDQTRKAMEALLPAFSLGLQRNAADPTGLSQLFGLVGTGGPGRAPPPSQADLLVQQIFGSSHLSQAVVQQAAMASGVASPVLRQMMPMVAGMVVAGIVHLMLNQPQATPAPPPPTPLPNGFSPGAYWSEMMKVWSSAMAPPAAVEAKPRRAGAAALPPPASRAETKPNAAGNPSAVAGEPYAILQQMFDAGVEAQQENVKAMQSLFDSFWKSPRTKA
ncbi:DUF937 domain-containing protein [Methylobacterium sp. Leaf466]|uniref:DUF937 domain-containing protein n=1 Tax=Methylobacterium sp. Leaf466 TaxID=1736386 RepID=UPI0006FF98B3|nr:DUF937 domain-containing protein [Methylobacterium sp. Leaf466]KQT80753.1 hypothetical protein ASG59_04850 [Methylobacterium sp. Leaf466]